MAGLKTNKKASTTLPKKPVNHPRALCERAKLWFWIEYKDRHTRFHTDLHFSVSGSGVEKTGKGIDGFVSYSPIREGTYTLKFERKEWNLSRLDFNFPVEIGPA